MIEIEAVYQGGVLKPLGELRLNENQKVRLSIQPLRENEIRAWLERVQRLQQQIVATRGFFPDSTPDISEDRAR